MMVMYTRANGKQTKPTVKESLSNLMIPNFKVSYMTISKMVTAKKYGVMEPSTADNIKTALNMDKENFSGAITLYMMENFRKIIFKAKVL